MKQLITTVALIFTLIATADAADVQVRLSQREAYVGSPVTFQIAISDAGHYDQPSLPKIDGCDVRSAGAPSQSSQITIINGRRSESRSVVMQYLITPRREGAFTIPAMTFNVDGKKVTTSEQRFVASKSEAGDLLFVEIEGGKEKVYVGQPLDLKLKIWIKPFRDPASGRTLSEGDMWNMISDSTSWGGFAGRMKELVENRQRPGGHEVLRDDGNGHERAYYLYEVKAKVYPKRAGKIDASDVQIVVDYPTALGRSRSPFGGMLDDDMFAGNSMIARMMDDDFFSSSFGNRLAVTDTRPIVGEVRVDATEVFPVPTVGRPADYRGAVGQYRIITQATPTTVDAGDPITLHIGIAGTGPMELVQAPPLHEQSDLTAEFKVTDESLAGFVKDDSKVFSTTIRPRREGITEIPGIRFSFFDPATETFQTVTSHPIAITVNKSETLALDSIVGTARHAESGANEIHTDRKLPDFTNRSDASVLLTQIPTGKDKWWWAFVIFPPFVCLAAFFIKNGRSIVAQLPNMRSAKARSLAQIARAKDRDALVEAMVQFVLARTGVGHSEKAPSLDRSELANSATCAIGRLRVAGLYELANEVEHFLNQLVSQRSQDLSGAIDEAVAMIEMIDSKVAANKKSQVKVTKRIARKFATQRPLGLLLMAIVLASTTCPSAMAEAPVELNDGAASTLLAEASRAYEAGIAKSTVDSADAKELLSEATGKYQTLVDSGISNASLFSNLGNAYLQTGRVGYAIVNYEKALQLDPDNAQVIKNLAYANSQVVGGQTQKAADSGLRFYNQQLVHFVGNRPIMWSLGLSSILFWGLVTLRIVHRPFPLWRCAATPLVILLLSLTSVVLTETAERPNWNAVIVADNVSIREGDGEQFTPVVSLDAAQGHRVESLATRGTWTQIRTAEGHVGWVAAKDVAMLEPQT